jgi:hypothetical protein
VASAPAAAPAPAAADAPAPKPLSPTEAKAAEQLSNWYLQPPRLSAKATPSAPPGQRLPSALRETLPDRRELPAERPPVDLDAAANRLVDAIPLPFRSQRVRARTAVSDLLHGSEIARRAGARTLTSLGILSEPILLECGRSPSPEVAETCLESLVQIGSNKISLLLPQIANSPDHALRLAALRVAHHLDDATRRPLLLTALRDPHPTLRRRAMTYLAWERAAWAKAEILRLCYDQDPTVKWAALEALAAIHPEEASERLDSMYPGMDSVLRRHAVRLLERQKRPPEGGDQRAPGSYDSGLGSKGTW